VKRDDLVSGQVRFRVGDAQTVLGPGGVRLMPRHIEHELWNDTEELAQIIEI
jgi:quercetin dioxygenase-like cupin family protein